MLDPRLMQVLAPCRIEPRRNLSGRIRGDRLSKRKGISIEFADFRAYTDGDDLRHLDWNVLARHDTPVLRTYQDEEDLIVYVLIDCSASMRFGEPSKHEFAKQCANALGFAALTGADAVALGTLSPYSLARIRRGRVNTVRLTHELGQLKCTDRGLLGESLRQFCRTQARSGVVIILSDFLEPGADRAIRGIAARGHEVWAVQILSPIETNPSIEGDLTMIDVESGSRVELTATSSVLAEYHQNLAQHLSAVEEAVRAVGGRYCLVETTDGIEAVIKNVWLRERWLVR